MRVSKKATHLIGSEIIKLAAEVNSLKAQGKDILNLTIGDFDPAVFPLPHTLQDAIIDAYRAGHTNYPQADGMASLREALSAWYAQDLGLQYAPETEIIVAGGGRPLIYSVYLAVVNPGDKVLYPVPSWNNNHYTYLADGVAIEVEALPENGFMPTPDQLLPHLKEVALVSLCSPLNPTGTVIRPEFLKTISEAIVQENKQRETDGRRPVFLMYDQIYWTLTAQGISHVQPVALCPDIRPYTIFVDGISKSFAATGVRVGWSMGPADVIGKMKPILAHIGAWAPKPEQMAVASYVNTSAAKADVESIQKAAMDRLTRLHAGFQSLKAEGFPFDSIAPQGAIYLSVRVDLPQAGEWLLKEAGVALVPFSAFGALSSQAWFRLSVGTLRTEDIEPLFARLRTLLS